MSIDKSTTGDPKRISIVRNITLESNFFTLYRSTIKSLMEDRENRKMITDIIDNGELSYKEKLNQIVKVIRTITNGIIHFIIMTPFTLKTLSVISYKECKNTETVGVFTDGCILNVPDKNTQS